MTMGSDSGGEDERWKGDMTGIRQCLATVLDSPRATCIYSADSNMAGAVTTAGGVLAVSIRSISSCLSGLESCLCSLPHTSICCSTCGTLA